VGELDGTIIALDLLDFEPIEGVNFIQGDFREDSVLRQLEEALAGRPVDLVVSDMAPNLSGIASADAARIEHLVELAVDFSRQHLRPEGALVARCFTGAVTILWSSCSSRRSGGQGAQAQVLAGQIGRNLSGGPGSETQLNGQWRVCSVE
jgi:hypothetical protein